jgi:hypothetical membrane protein
VGDGSGRARRVGRHQHRAEPDPDADPPVRAEGVITRRVGMLGALGLLGPVFFAATFLVGAIRPGYSLVRGEVSDLALGSDGWMLTASFAFFGVLLAGFALGLRGGLAHDAAARRGGVMLAVSGVGLAALAAFPTDASYRHPTVHGAVHFVLYVVTVIAFVGSIWCFARAFGRDRRWRRYGWFSRVIGLVALALFVVLVGFGAHGIGDRAEPLSAVTGGLERGLIGLFCAWVLVVAQRHVRLAFAPARGGRRAPRRRV